MSRNTEVDERALAAAAIAVRARAYAPYSGFSVGAALIDEHGKLHTGANVENAAYPQCLCAEAAAIGAMVASGGRRIQAVAIAGPNETPCTPCGGCRQRLREFAPPELPVIIVGVRDVFARYTLGELLPSSFGPENL